MNEILLLGGGGHCLSVIDSIEQDNKYKIVGIIDIKEKVGQNVGGYEIIGTDNDLRKFYLSGVKQAIISLGSIGKSFHRERLYEICKANGFILPIIKDPSAIITPRVDIGEGTYIAKGVMINREVTIGKNSILNTGCIIEHNCYVGDFAHIAPGVKLGGYVIIGNSTHIGIGTTIIQGISVGNNAFLGSASNVINDVPHNVKAFGNPCRVVGEI